MKKIPTTHSRRNFLKSSLTGIAGVTIIPGTIVKKSRADNYEMDDKSFIYRTLGRTGIKLPIVSIGAGCWDKSIYQAALDSGITHIDTSQYYYNGRHEELIGDVLKGRDRESVIIATSILFGAGDPDDAKYAEKLREYPLSDKIDESLQRLGLDYVDIFYMAGINSRKTVLFEPFMEKMLAIKREKKTQFIGIATHQNEPEVIRATVDAEIFDVILTSYNFMQTHNKELDDAIAIAAKNDIGIIAMKTMAGGYWDKERKHAINYKAALKWALQNEVVHSAIPGASSHDQLKDNLSVMDDLVLSDQEKKDLKWGEENSSTGLYCRQCQVCVPQCPFQLGIPDIMRSFMYAYGYRNLALAKGVMPVADIPCDECGACKVICPNGIMVKERIVDIARIRDIPVEFFG